MSYHCAVPEGRKDLWGVHRRWGTREDEAGEEEVGQCAIVIFHSIVRALKRALGEGVHCHQDPRFSLVSEQKVGTALPLPISGFDKVFDEIFTIFRGLFCDAFIQFIITLQKIVSQTHVSLFDQLETN